jgi:ubiquinone biosynthesis protein COQ9
MSGGEDELSGDLDALRERVLDATLRHIPFDGWTHAALARGGDDLGLDAGGLYRAFPGSVGELLAFYLARADRRMVAALAQEDPSALKVRERVARAVRLRLEQSADQREVVRRALAVLALPHNAPLAARSLYRTVDEIWHWAGDRATDWNFYTKRALLAGVYGATLLYWLEDKSEGSADSWAFLDRRIADALRVPQLVGRAGRLGDFLPNPVRFIRRMRAGLHPE